MRIHHTEYVMPASGMLFANDHDVGRGAQWSQQVYVKASNTESRDAFGNSVALSGDGSTLAVGATEEDSVAVGVDGNQDDNGRLHAGAVYLY